MNDASLPWPRLWRMGIIALGVLILCSCQMVDAAARRARSERREVGRLRDLAVAAMAGAEIAPPVAAMPVPVAAQGNVPPGQPSGLGCRRALAQGDVPPGMEAQGDVPPGQPSGPWSPPGIEKPWPKSEYVRDGGHVGAP